MTRFSDEGGIWTHCSAETWNSTWCVHMLNPYYTDFMISYVAKALKRTKLYWSMYHHQQQTNEIDYEWGYIARKIVVPADTFTTALWLYIFLCSDGCLNALCLPLLQHRYVDVICGRGHHPLSCQLTWTGNILKSILHSLKTFSIWPVVK